MIRGVGIDVCEIDRIFTAIESHGERFLKRILNPLEYDEIINLDTPLKAAFCAKRFAAKEAFSKAFGTGIGRNFTFQDIWIEHATMGRPVLRWEADHPTLCVLSNSEVHLSISDERTIAVAFCAIESF